MSVKNIKERKVEDYGHLSDIGHVYEIPDTYIGGTMPIEQNILLFKNSKFIEDKITLPEGVQRLFLEILSNAGDNTYASREADIDPGDIKVEMNDEIIKITNGGRHIDLKKIKLIERGRDYDVVETTNDDPEGIWLPELIFGTLRSSNNYKKDKPRMGCGRNGYGAKLVAIFSKYFSVEVDDPVQKLRFKGIWEDNMFKNDKNGKPEIIVEKDSSIKKGRVSIAWKLDFERFKMKKYNIKDVQLFKRFLIDFSFTCKVKGFFNDEELDYRDIRKYSELFFTEEQIKNHFVRYIWQETPEEFLKITPAVLHKKVSEAKKAEHIPMFEAMVIDTPDNGKSISYVNGLITVDNGAHVDSIQNPIFNFVIEQIKAKQKKDGGRKLNLRNIKIKNHLSIIVNARIPNPIYGSQSKTKLASPSFKVDIPEDVLKKMINWELFSRLNAEIEAMDYKNASASDGKKTSRITCERGEDAGEAGKKESNKCILFLCEGDSAANYPMKRLCMLEGGKKYHGYLPMKGVLLNTTKASPQVYANNKVIADIKVFIGLQEKVDYNLKINRDQLRYGFICIATDADDDGSHILTLVIDFFSQKFRGLLTHNMVGYLRTPVIKVYKGKKILKRFFNTMAYDEWSKKNDLTGLKVKYFKGLGSSKDDDIKDDLKTAPTMICFYDSSAAKNLDVAFSKNGANDRKKWIAEFRDKFQIDDVITMDISSFLDDTKVNHGDKELVKPQDISQLINRELVIYSMKSLTRAIPSEYDFFKECHRKIIYAALQYFKYNPSGGKEEKTSQFASRVASMVQYHHGEKSLSDSAIKMTQSFIGSNNMPYFRAEGQFGSRACGGKKAADPRYSFLHLAWWIPYVFIKESIDIIPRRRNEDEECEPLWLPAVIPMPIANSWMGIATGYSSQIPCHNPIELTDFFIAKCKKLKPDPIAPWYNNYKGKLEIVDCEKHKIDPDSELLPAEISSEKPMGVIGRMVTVEEYDRDEMDEAGKNNLHILKNMKESKLRLATTGRFSLIGEHKHGPILRVTELGVGHFIGDYRKWLESLLEIKGAGVEQRPIYDFEDNSDTENADFTIHWNSNWKPPTAQNLKLVKSIGISNITLIDHYGFPKKYQNIEEILNVYYEHMIKHYEDVRKNRIDKEEKNMINIDYKMQLITLIAIKKVIKYENVKKEEIKRQLEEHKIPFEYFDKSKLTDLTEEDIQKYMEKMEEAKARLELARKTTAAEIWISHLIPLREQLVKCKKGKFYKFTE